MPFELQVALRYLLAKRRQLLGDMEGMEREALQAEASNLSHLPVHMADMGTDNYEQEFTLSLVDRDRKFIDESIADFDRFIELAPGQAPQATQSQSQAAAASP